MRHFQFLLGLALAGIFAASSQAAISYQYMAVIAGQATDTASGTAYTANTGDTVVITFYLREILTEGSASFINANRVEVANPGYEDPSGGNYPKIGLGSIGLRVQRTSGDSIINTVGTTLQNITPNSTIGPFTSFSTIDGAGSPVSATTSGFPAKGATLASGAEMTIAVSASGATTGAQPIAFSATENRVALGSIKFLVGSATTTWSVGAQSSAGTKTYSFTDLNGGGQISTDGIIPAISDRVELDFNHNEVVGVNPAFTGATMNPFTLTINVGVIPEPSSMALVGLAVSGFGFAGYRRRKLMQQA